MVNGESVLMACATHEEDYTLTTVERVWRRHNLYKSHYITTPQSSQKSTQCAIGEPSFGTQGSPEDFST